MRICTFASSSSGNCTLVSHGSTHILIDAGISLRRIRDSLRLMGLTPDELTCALITHEHIDHISGISILVKYHKTPLFTSLGTGRGICAAVPEAEPYLNLFDAGVELALGGVAVRSFRTPHDSADSVGFTIDAGGKKLVYATDLGCLTEEVLAASLGADVAIIEANHDRDMVKNGPYPPFLKKRILSGRGHLSNSDCGELAVKLAGSGAAFIQLSHLSRENNTPELARKTVEEALLGADVTPGADIQVDVAPPGAPGRIYEL